MGIGCVCCVALHEKLFIHSLAVLPTMQGKGFGTKLLLEVEKLALRLGAVKLEGTVDACGGSAYATQLRFQKCLDPGNKGMLHSNSWRLCSRGKWANCCFGPCGSQCRLWRCQCFNGFQLLWMTYEATKQST